MQAVLRKIMAFAGQDSTNPYAAYGLSRHIKDQTHLCHAPFNNMYFNVHGHVAPCWLTLDSAESYPHKSIHDIWFGKRFTDIRTAIHSKSLDKFCSTCKHNIESGNYVSVLAKLYDVEQKLEEYPTSMEFELSNTCNLECVMCKGELSSSIRQQREHLPPLISPYDSQFVKQLESFIPHLREAKFLGGEPFLINIYYEIWDLIKVLNPRIKISITTNGSVLNSRIKDIIESLDFNLIISIDSFFKETYEQIRIKGDYERVMTNLDYFLSYAKSKNKYLQVSINPLRKNWQELHHYVSFCNSRNIFLWFNTVTYPYDEALWTWDSASINKVYEYLSSSTIEDGFGNKEIIKSNHRNFKNLVDVQIKTWYKEALANEQKRLSVSAASYKELLWTDIERYIDTDAYLGQHQKNQKKIFYRHLMERIQSQYLNTKKDIFENLYKKPLSHILSIKDPIDLEQLLKP